MRRRKRPQEIQTTAALALIDQLLAYYRDQPARVYADAGTSLLDWQYEIENWGLDDLGRLNLWGWAEKAGMEVPAWCRMVTSPRPDGDHR
jgi:hypothetical protein